MAGTPGTGVIRLDQVNHMGRDEFVDTFGRLFQGPSWVAERAYDQRPFADTHDLRVSFQEALFTSDRPEQHDLLPSTRTWAATRWTARAERGVKHAIRRSAGLTLLNDEDHEEFAHLTQAYRERFGIPLIVSVRDVEKRDQILKSGWERMQNSPTQEHAAAVIEVAKIANHRFDDLVADANPMLGARAANLEAVPTAVQPTDPAGDRDGADRRAAAVQRDVRQRGQGDTAVLPGRPALGRRRRRRPPLPNRRRRCCIGPGPPRSSFTDEELDAALARHPRIGEQAGAGHDAEFSDREQAAVGDADPAITEAIRAALRGRGQRRTLQGERACRTAAGELTPDGRHRAASPACLLATSGVRRRR